jgi:plastocyanin
MTKRAPAALGVLLFCLALAAPASAQDGVQRLKFSYGPVKITPGQNTIALERNDQRPAVDGWIVGFKPDLVYADGTVPRVDVIHLHHGVWLKGFRPLFAAGEEKTEVTAPRGFGWRYRTSDAWHMNHMIHNLTPTPTEVYITYELAFIPAGSPAAAAIQEVETAWLDTVGGAYPVFDAKRGAGGSDRRFTYPDEAGDVPRPQWTVPEDGAIVGSGGHLHPGGLWTDLKLTRDGRTTRLFRSKAVYFEPAGAVSWDVAMTGTPNDWRVKLRKGDVLWTSATYGTKRAAWWESMGIMVAYMADSGPGRNPFNRRVSFPGRPTHGHLPENDNHGGDSVELPDARELPDGPTPSGAIDILSFKYTLGDLSLAGQGRLPPVVQQGQSLTFRNADDGSRVYHSLTSCKAPCNRSTGIAYPIADGPVQFESNTLGSAVPPATGALEWQTPNNLDRGTYTYFCRIHPFMRGAFRVK